MNIFNNKNLRIVWTILRVWLGYSWLTAGLEKFSSSAWIGDKAGVAISGFFQGALANSTGEYPQVMSWYATFIEKVAMPNATSFSYSIVFGEILVGIGLILGALTTVSLIGSAFMSLNFLLAGTSYTNPVMYTIAILLLIAGTHSYYFGLDRLFVFPLLNKKLTPKLKKVLPGVFGRG